MNSPAEIQGRIFGPDGTSICNTVPAQDEIVVFALPQDPAIPPPEPALVSCPNNRYSITAEPGPYVLHAEFTALDGLGRIPNQAAFPQFTLREDGAVRNLRLEEGLPLRGRATIDGEGFPGVLIIAAHEFTFGFGPPGLSTEDGRWADVLPFEIPPFDPTQLRRPMILQPGHQYEVFGECGRILGTVVREDFPFERFIFPTERQAVDCELETGAPDRFTHTRNRIAVSALPGDIGGLTDGARNPELGTGYGVQFPVRPGRRPGHDDRTLSQLYLGGLLIGVGSETVLNGVFGGHLECNLELENACWDLGLDATAEVRRTADGGRVVTWRYSDAPSAEGVGLRIVQRSFDAPDGHDYVLFRFTIRNASGERQRVNPGLFTDWDVDQFHFEDLGHRLRNGRLMAQSNAEEGGDIRVGTLMIGETAPTGGYFFTGFEVPSVTDQIRALRGRLTATVSGPDDLRYIQSVEPLTLRPGEETDLWVAVLAGDDAAAFNRTADAAAEDIGRRRAALRDLATEEQGTLEGEWTNAAPRAATPARTRTCGKDCLLKLKSGAAPRPRLR